MFWKKKNKSPITIEDEEWLNSDLGWLKDVLSEPHFLEIKTVTPTKEFYNIEFTGIEKDAQFVLNRTKELMCVKNDKIKLEFFDDSPVQMDDGSILTTPADINGSWESAAGLYEKKENNTTIYIERQQLKNPISLIATVAHELSHVILLGKKIIEENDEYLTDLMAITYGFGIFLGNSRFSFSQFSKGAMLGWQSSSQGYLPEQIIAFSMAWLSIKRNENTDYKQFLNKTMLKYFNQSYKYLSSDN
ncbi:hypothetical protein FDT66_08770 [Polaribacter aestuariivivens]|uniref:Uncharacterized protein n=1 Tax=Polaribacter aestuariivivens TaxID=2304626 RepID=A0A5S3N3P5_9FLAO|nr:hypothetical protein [Polaribacter aestuariivivens]TMM29951.1 hypothetical protein FDT66_08770 [Polaribacter aestuariivivens]